VKRWGGIRIVKAYRAERSERLVFTKGANALFRNIRERPWTGHLERRRVSPTIIIGRDRDPDDPRGRKRDPVPDR